MKTDILTQFISARKALLNEKAQLEARLEQLNQTLPEAPAAVAGVSKPVAQVPPPALSPISLRAAVLNVAAGHPMTKPEIRAAIQKLGYRTTSRHPQRLLDNLLYGKNPKFKNENGRFSPLSTATGPAPAKAAPKAAKPPEKRTLSAATRAKMSASAKARWTKTKKAGGKRLKAV